MNECKKIEEKLPAYLEGTLSREEKGGIGEHLASCRHCSSVLEDLKKTADLVKSLQEVEPPPWFTQKIMSRVREEAAQKRGLFQKLFYPLHIKVPVEAFAAALIVVLTLQVYRTIEPEMKAVQPSMESARPAAKDELERQREKMARGYPAPAGETVQKKQPGEGRGPAKGYGERTETIRREESPSFAKPPDQLLTAPQKTGVSEKREQEMRTAAPPSHAEPALAKKTAAPAASGAPSEKTAESYTSADVRLRGAREQEAARMGGALTGFAAAKQESIDITLFVTDVPSAALEVENLLGKLSGRAIERQPREEAEIITAELTGDKARELPNGLQTIGRIDEKAPRPAVGEGNVSVRILITHKP